MYMYRCIYTYMYNVNVWYISIYKLTICKDFFCSKEFHLHLIAFGIGKYGENFRNNLKHWKTKS